MAEYTNGYHDLRGNGKAPRGQSERDELFSVATSDGCELIHFEGEAFALVPRKGDQKTHSILFGVQTLAAVTASEAVQALREQGRRQ